MDVLISIIIPVFNVEKYLTECLESVINQTYKKIEVLLIDDGSTDESGRICDDFAEKDSRIKVIHKENQGVSSARNKGLDLAQGEYITFIDSDDFVSSEYIEEMYKTIREDISTEIVMCNFAHFKNGAIVESNEILPDCVDLSRDNKDCKEFLSRFFCISKRTIFGSACRILWKKNIINQCRFHTNITISEDLLFVLQTFFNAKKLKSVSHTGYFYRINEGSVTKSYKSNYLSSQLNLSKELEIIFSGVDGFNCILQTYNALLCYYVFSNEIKNRNKGIWKQNISAARKSALYSYFNLKNGLKFYGIKSKIKFLVIWLLVKTRLV